MWCLSGEKASVQPTTGNFASGDLLEIRPSRFLYISHSNVRQTSDLEFTNKGFVQDETDNDAVEINHNESVVSYKLHRDQQHSVINSDASYLAPSATRGMVSLEPQNWVIFMIHGVGCSSASWRYQISYFSNCGFRVVAPDLIGHGFSRVSTNPNDYTFKNLAADVLAIFDKYADGRGNVLIGHSLGTALCSYVAHKRPYAVTKLVMLASGAPCALEPPACDVFRLPLCCLYIVKPCCKAYLRRKMYSSHQKVESNISEFPVSVKVIKSVMRGQYWPEGDEMFHHKLKVDTQLLYGSEDEVVSKEDEFGMFEALWSCKFDIIEKASHMLMQERPDIVNSLIHKFICQPIPAMSTIIDYHVAGFIDAQYNDSSNGSSFFKTVQYHG